jgi:Lrp/AsnC family transcriptional regulator, leucine-responsive regulatory protein
VRKANELDEFDRRILALLEEDGRRPTSDIARSVGLSAASVAERIARMSDIGVIQGFGVKIDAGALGCQIAALVRFEPNSYSDAEGVRKAASHPAVRSVYKVLGNWLLIMVVRVRTMAELNAMLLELNEHGKTESSMIVNSELEDLPWFAADDRDPIDILRRKNRGY